jgi:hypothetical protein
MMYHWVLFPTKSSLLKESAKFVDDSSVLWLKFDSHAWHALLGGLRIIMRCHYQSVKTMDEIL